MSWLRAVLPVASVVVLTILAVLPWGVPVEDRVALPLLSGAASYYWTCDTSLDRHTPWQHGQDRQHHDGRDGQ